MNWTNRPVEQDAVLIDCEIDLVAHVLDVQGRRLSVRELLNTGAVASVMPVGTWPGMGFQVHYCLLINMDSMKIYKINHVTNAMIK